MAELEKFWQPEPIRPLTYLVFVDRDTQRLLAREFRAHTSMQAAELFYAQFKDYRQYPVLVQLQGSTIINTYSYVEPHEGFVKRGRGQ